VPDAIVQVLQNRSGVHVCPSEAEGWGHYLVEGMSAGAVVITTDAPPMNEIVQPEHGVLCDYSTSTPMHFGTKYFVSPEALEAAVRSTLERDPADLQAMGRLARACYLDNHRAFVARLTTAVAELVS
jgi:glycosyltransferase involved in cell wall biosynthesis